MGKGKRHGGEHHGHDNGDGGRREPDRPRQAGFVPPGANPGTHNHGARPHGTANGNGRALHRDQFGYGFEKHFNVPPRISRCPTALIEAVNDFHFAMMNDTPRNEFYYEALRRRIVSGSSGVVEIGAGSGLLSMMAAKLGAKWVVAVEGSAEMAALARDNIRANGLEDRITVLNLLSTDLQKADLPGVPDILVSEIFGTLLLGESALDYIADMRQRLLPRGCPIVPPLGTQFAVLIECAELDRICSVDQWNGIRMSRVNALKDTASCVFTKKYGFRMSSVPYQELCDPIPVAEIDFTRDRPGCLALERTFSVPITHSGTAHAMLLFWKAMDGDLVMSTNPRDTISNFPRDMQWGQALQLLDAGLDAGSPTPVTVSKGETRAVKCVCSDDSVILQFTVLPPRPSAAEVVEPRDGVAEPPQPSAAVRGQ